MSFDKIFDFTAGVYFNFYNIYAVYMRCMRDMVHCLCGLYALYACRDILYVRSVFIVCTNVQVVCENV